MSRFTTLAPRLQLGAGVSGLLSSAAHAHPDAVFLEDHFGSVLTFAEAEDKSLRLASYFRAVEIVPGDRVAIHLRNRVELAIALFAIARVGGIFTVLNPKLRPKGLAGILAQAEPSLILVDETTVANLDGIALGEARIVSIDGDCWTSALAREPTSEDRIGCENEIASIIFTSGSTGTPRGVVLSHDNITHVVAAIQNRLHYRPGDVIGGFLPLAFDYGLHQIFLAAHSGAKLYIGDPDQVGPRLPQILRSSRITILPGVPSVFAALVTLGRRGPLELPELRAVTNTGESLPLSHIGELRRHFPGLEVFVMYGLTECKRVSILLPAEFEAHSDTVGRALDGTEVYSVDGEGRRLPPGERGELVVRGRHVALGYWRAPEETARRFRKDALKNDVELFTGDTGLVDAEGFIHFCARSVDWIKHRGYRLSPDEVESEASQLGGVVEVALLQRESDDTLHLFVTVSDPAADSVSIRKGLGGVLEPVKVPDRVVILTEMPKSLTGKIDRKSLAARLGD